MQFKIGQPMITIMNMFNIIVHHTLKIFKYHPPCNNNNIYLTSNIQCI